MHVVCQDSKTFSSGVQYTLTSQPSEAQDGMRVLDTMRRTKIETCNRDLNDGVCARLQGGPVVPLASKVVACVFLPPPREAESTECCSGQALLEGKRREPRSAGRVLFARTELP